MHRLFFVLAFMNIMIPAQAEALKHDPFSRPLLAIPTPSSNAATANGTTTSQVNTSAETTIAAEQGWNPTLTAVMVAGKNSLVNIEGKIIRIGEKADGYRLIKVKDSQAIFVKDGKTIVLRMEDQMQEQNKMRGR